MVSKKIQPVALAGLAVIWLAMLVFGGAAWEIDRGVLAALYSGGDPALAGAATLLTALGGWMVLIPVTLGAAGLLLLRGKRRDALVLLAIILSGRLLVELQKNLTDRPRPAEVDRLVTVHSLSFPSGHAANSMIAYLTIALIVLPRRAAIAAAIALSMLIGLSRIVLGVHWPSDVLAGWAFGLFWTIALIRLAQPRRVESGV